MMIVPEAANTPPTPRQTEILASGIWAASRLPVGRVKCAFPGSRERRQSLRNHGSPLSPASAAPELCFEVQSLAGGGSPSASQRLRCRSATWGMRRTASLIDCAVFSRICCRQFSDASEHLPPRCEARSIPFPLQFGTPENGHINRFVPISQKQNAGGILGCVKGGRTKRLPCHAGTILIF